MDKVELAWAGGHDFVPAEGQEGCDALSPKEMILFATAQSVGRTIMMLLGAVTERIESLRITIEGDLIHRPIPSQSIYREFRLRYDVVCTDPDDHSRISRVIELAHGKYCGMIRMLKMIAPITYDIYIHTVTSHERKEVTVEQ